MKKNILILDDVHPLLIEELQKKYNVVYKEKYSENTLPALLKNIDVLVVRTGINVTKKIIDSAPSLKLIARAGAGLDNVDVNYAQKKKIKCVNSGEANADAVGEHALGMLLSLFNKIHSANYDVRNGLWEREKNRGIELTGKTIGIIGYGNTGSAFARKLRGFDVEILSYDKYKKNFGNNYVNEVSMKNIFEKCDIVSLHIPLTDDTLHLADEKFFTSFKKNIYFINTSRGAVADAAAIVKFLKNKKLLGCCLDVLETEPPQKGNKFFKKYFEYISLSENVVLTPHVAGWSNESYIKISEVLLKKILHFLKK